MKVNVYKTRADMGRAAASAVAEKIAGLLRGKEHVNVVFAAAPSQEEFLAELREMPVEWGRVRAFHMDEYLGLAGDAPQGFGNFLRDRLFSIVPFYEVFYMGGVSAEDYAALLEVYRTDIVCLGIGENTHLAFNDPHVARFDDPETVKVVDLDMDCRRQQVNDGCFATIEEVPTHALTMTIPALMRATFAFVIVPGPRKAVAVQHTLYDAISERYPSTILRRHPNAKMFVDSDSSIYLGK
jgi:glucosamine-6-phosphate deaminase